MTSIIKKTYIGFRAVLVAAAILAAGSSAAEAATLAAGSSAAEAATLAPGPLRIQDLQWFTCLAVNAHTGDVAAKVDVMVAGGGCGAGASCPSLSPAGVCAADNQAGSANYRHCTITTTNRKAVRGTFCTNTTRVCIPVQ